ncbi:unnamed protein product, partial [Brassica rapa]
LSIPLDCLGDFGPPGLSVRYTHDVCGCPSAHTGRPCVSVSTHRTSVCVRQHTQDIWGCPCVSVCVHQHTQDVRGCPSVHISTRCTHRTSVGVRQHTQDDVRGCPPAHTGRPGCPCVSVCVRLTHMTSVDVRVCPSVTVSTHRTSVSVHQFTYQHIG